ncbi:hypothetical protein KP509_32G059500 [Ceratopteris richardii]|uniref:Uncharacterized protein n=1 Tax=Ceratopteris richardii TaxID=49495 RepID=A0A8T2QU80_CERRI|nr:hypothetical protein KP509_32G059500 [Ceratopteris richardii]
MAYKAMLAAVSPARGSAFFLIVAILAALIDGIEPVQGTIECEELPIEECAFAVSSSGARCVLEKQVTSHAAPQFKCQTSIIMAERPLEWIESEDCIQTCGLQRMSVGLSTDALLERDFTRRLCFSQCRRNCPNINDLYTNLAAEEGIDLPSVCDSLKPKIRRLGAVQKQLQNTITSQHTEILFQNKIDSQNFQTQPSSATPSASPSPIPITGWPNTPAPISAPEKPYPPASEAPACDGDEAEPPYPYVDEYPPYEEQSPSPIPATEEPAAAPYFLTYAGSPVPVPSPSPQNSHSSVWV